MRRPNFESVLPCGQHIRANGIRQHYYRYGDKGPVLLLIPGIASPAALWGFVGESLSEHFDVFVLDVRGRGLSEAGAHLDYGLEALAEDIVSFAQALGLSSYTIVGHSMGARIALRAAAKHAAGIERLVLLDPPVSGPGRRAYPSSLTELLGLISAAKRGEVIPLLRSAQSVWPEVHLCRRAEWLCTCDERAVEVAYSDFHEQDMHSDLRMMTVPVALLIASEGGVIRADDERELHDLLPEMITHRVAEAGHQMQIDNFTGLMDALGVVLGVAFSAASSDQ